MNGYAYTVKKRVRRTAVPLACGGADGALPLGLRGENGALCAGTDMRPLPAEGLPEGVQAVFAANGAYLAVAGGAAYVRTANAAAFSRASLTFARVPACVRVYDDAAGEALLLSDGEKSALLTADGLSEEGVPAFTAAAYAFERLWLATGECGGARLRYSSFRDWRDFAEAAGGGGYADLPDGKGRVVALADFENYIYVFREYGVQRLYARGDERAFELRDAWACARVYGQTVAVCGGRIVWLGEDGLHAFDGGAASSFAPGFSARLCGTEQTDARGCTANGRYYLQAEARLSGGRARALFSFAEDGSEGSALSGAFGGLACCGGRALAVYGGAPCVLCEGAVRGGLCVRRAWEGTVYPPAGAALLQRLHLDADAGFAVTVEGARGTRTFRAAKGGAQSFPVALFGAKFRVRIEGTGQCGRVRSLAVSWAYEEAAYDGQ